MSCAEARDRLSDYCDGELSSTERIELEAHLDSCSACREELEAERELLRRAAAWRRDLDPPRDLWPGIEARISHRPASVVRGPWWSVSRAGLAAAVVVAAAVLLLLFRGVETPVGPEVERTAVESPDRGADVALARASERARVEGGLLQVREDLLRSIAERRGELDPATQEMVDRNLEIIDRAIGEIYQALEEDPESLTLELLLASTHQLEVEFLKQVNVL